MTRISEIADYLGSMSIGDTEAAWKAEVLETIRTRWPDVTAAELTAAFEIALLDLRAQVIEAATHNLRRAAGRGARDG